MKKQNLATVIIGLRAKNIPKHMTLFWTSNIMSQMSDSTINMQSQTSGCLKPLRTEYECFGNLWKVFCSNVKCTFLSYQSINIQYIIPESAGDSASSSQHFFVVEPQIGVATPAETTGPPRRERNSCHLLGCGRGL